MENKYVEETGSSSNKDRQRHWPPGIEPVFSKTGHSPRELKSWAKRTGFNTKSFEETSLRYDINEGGEDPVSALPVRRDLVFGTEKKLGRGHRNGAESMGKMEPVLGNRSAGAEINPVSDPESAGRKDSGRVCEKEKGRIGVGQEHDLKNDRKVGNDLPMCVKDEGINGAKGGNGGGVADNGPGYGETGKNDLELGIYADPPDAHNKHLLNSGLICDLVENPGFDFAGQLLFYGIQHYLSLIGSLVFIPLIMVPTMGGTDGDTANVISTVLLVSGLTTIMHLFFGSRLPLVQGSSYVYLAPALVISNSEEYRNLSENKFMHIMRELQGAIIVGSIFQFILGYSGLMSLILRLINPVVVAPTVAAVGLAFFSFGFSQAGSCVEISIPLIVLVLIFTLYLRNFSIFGHHIFLVYAVPVSVAILWALAFFLTAGGAYNYKGCSSNIPSSNILSDTCRKHALTAKRCRTDVSVALKMASWIRIPYPCQWGMPAFSFRTSIIMTIVSIVASVDSIGSYHATSLLISLNPPTPGVVSRGIGLEGLSGILAGLWGTGTGSTTLRENIHTLDATKMANRKALAVGAVFLVLLSFLGKFCAVLASIPLALAAAVLCFTWSLVVALGLSTMRYTQSSSPRNMLIVGFTLFISLSVPAFFQQYPPESRLVLPSYLVPYAAASDGPINTRSKGLNYALNSLLSLNMVVALLVAIILDNTVPGNREERGAYIWSSSQNSPADPSLLGAYLLPEKVRPLFRWAKWVGS